MALTWRENPVKTEPAGQHPETHWRDAVEGCAEAGFKRSFMVSFDLRRLHADRQSTRLLDDLKELLAELEEFLTHPSLSRVAAWRGGEQQTILDLEGFLPPSCTCLEEAARSPLSAIMRHRFGPAVAEGTFGNADLALDPPPAALPAGTVIQAVIDDAIAIAHARFMGPDGKPRITDFWEMSGCTDQADALGTGSQRYPGVMYDSNALERLFKTHERADQGYREAALYRQISAEAGLGSNPPGRWPVRWSSPFAMRGGHGTMVLDRLAGTSGASASTESDLRLASFPVMAAQLPQTIVGRSRALDLEFFILLAVDWILSRASRMQLAGSDRPVPVVINCSFGKYAGAHSGDGYFEENLKRRLADYGPAYLTLPSGNHRQEATRCVVRTRKAKAREKAKGKVRFAVQPDSTTPTLIEIHFPGCRIPKGIRLSLQDPSGAKEKMTPPPAGMFLEARSGFRTAARLYRHREEMAFSATGRSRETLVLAIAPTVSAGGNHRAPSGTWKLTIRKVPAQADGTIAVAQIERGSRLAGFRSIARQSYFLDATYRKFDRTGHLQAGDEGRHGKPAAIRREGAINGMVSGPDADEDRHIIIVGGHRMFDGHSSTFSGRGQGGPQTGPDISGPAEFAPALLPLLAAGMLSGSTAGLTGTSVSAPLAARLLTDILADHKPGDIPPVAQLRALAEPAGDPRLFGAGRLPTTDGRDRLRNRA